MVQILGRPSLYELITPERLNHLLLNLSKMTWKHYHNVDYCFLQTQQLRYFEIFSFVTIQCLISTISAVTSLRYIVQEFYCSTDVLGKAWLSLCYLLHLHPLHATWAVNSCFLVSIVTYCFIYSFYHIYNIFVIQLWCILPLSFFLMTLSSMISLVFCSLSDTCFVLVFLFLPPSFDFLNCFASWHDGTL